jgi:hypothetical protein
MGEKRWYELSVSNSFCFQGQTLQLAFLRIRTLSNWLVALVAILPAAWLSLCWMGKLVGQPMA